MEGIFWFVFGAVFGMFILPYVQRVTKRVRQRLAELDDLSNRNT